MVKRNADRGIAMKTEQIKKGRKVVYKGREYKIVDVYFGATGRLILELKDGDYTTDAKPEECEVTE